jgi:hypothetical protein
MATPAAANAAAIMPAPTPAHGLFALFGVFILTEKPVAVRRRQLFASRPAANANRCLIFRVRPHVFTCTRALIAAQPASGKALRRNTIRPRRRTNSKAPLPTNRGEGFWFWAWLFEEHPQRT